MWLTLALAVVIDGGTVDSSVLAMAIATCDQLVAEHCSDAADSATWYASFAADAEVTEARIEIHRTTRNGPLELARVLSLDPSASLQERGRAIGLVVAAHALSHREPTSEPAPRASEPQRPRGHASLDGAILLGSGFARRSPRLGAMVRGSFRGDQVPLGVTGSLRGSFAPEGAIGTDDPRLWWMHVTLGAFARLERGRFAGEGRLEMIGERLGASLEDTGHRVRTSSLRIGGQLGADLLARVSGPNWWFVGAETAWLGPPVVLTVRGGSRGREQTPSWVLFTGFRRAW